MGVSDELAKALEKALAELEHLRLVVTLKDEQIAAKDQQIAALNSLASIERMRAESWAKAAQERATANQLDARVVDSFERSINAYKADRDRLIVERDKARGRLKWVGAIGFVVGAGVVYSLK